MEHLHSTWKEFLQEHMDTILKFLGVGLFLFLLNRIAKIFKGKDGEFNIAEFCKFAAFIIFTTLACYMIWTEAHRPHEWHLFDAIYVFIVFGSLLSVLHMDHVITNMTKIFELAVRLRTKSPITEEKKQDESTTQPISL